MVVIITYCTLNTMMKIYNFFYRIDDKHIYFLHGIYLPEAVFSDADSVTLLSLIRITKD